MFLSVIAPVKSLDQPERHTESPFNRLPQTKWESRYISFSSCHPEQVNSYNLVISNSRQAGETFKYFSSHAHRGKWPKADSKWQSWVDSFINSCYDPEGFKTGKNFLRFLDASWSKWQPTSIYDSWTFLQQNYHVIEVVFLTDFCFPIVISNSRKAGKIF